MADNKYFIEKAKTGRSKCKDSKCKETIEAGELRIAKVVKNPFGDGDDTKNDYFHVPCIFTAQKRSRAGTKRIESTDDIEGFDDLTAAEKKVVEQAMADADSGKGTKRKAEKKSKKKKDDDDEDEDEEEEKPKKKKAAPKKKKAESDEEDEDDEDEKPKKKKAKVEKKVEKKEKPAKKSGGGGGDGEFERYELDEKFWEVKVEGSELTTRYGKVTAKNPQSTTKDFGSEDKAEKEKAKLIRQKTGKGYEAV